MGDVANPNPFILPISTVVDERVTVTAPFTAFTAEGSMTNTPKTDKNRKEIDRLRRTSPEYDQHLQHWRFCLKAYEGGPSYIGEDTLFKHTREHWMDYQDRLKRAHYANYCQPLVDFVPEFIFNNPIDRVPPEDLIDEYEQFKHNVDRSGTEINMFMQRLAEEMRIFGMCFVQIDKVEVPSTIDRASLSVQRAQELGLNMPYLIMVRPLEVLDWSADSFGQFTYLKRIEYIQRRNADMSVSSIERYHEWTPEAFQISEIDASDPEDPQLIGIVNDGPNRWKQVPFIPAYFRRSKANRDIGVPFLQDIAYQNRHVFNMTSLIDEFLYRQAFNVLAMEKDTSIPVRDQVDGEIGTSNVLEVPKGATHLPKYVTPPVAPAQFIQKERMAAIQEMYRQASQDIMSELFNGGSSRSGDQSKQAFARTIPVIAKMADELQMTEISIFRLWSRMLNKNWGDGKVAYKDDYSITQFQDLVLQLSMIFNQLHVISPTFIREEWKRIVREFDGRLPDDVRRQIYAEIDKLSDDELQQMFVVQPADQKAAPGLPSTANMLQGNAQTQLGTDKAISMATGNKASTKEKTADANKRAATNPNSTAAKAA